MSVQKWLNELEKLNIPENEMQDFIGALILSEMEKSGKYSHYVECELLHKLEIAGMCILTESLGDIKTNGINDNAFKTYSEISCLTETDLPKARKMLNEFLAKYNLNPSSHHNLIGVETTITFWEDMEEMGEKRNNVKQ